MTDPEEEARIERVAERLAETGLALPAHTPDPDPLPLRPLVWPEAEAFLRRNDQL